MVSSTKHETLIAPESDDASLKECLARSVIVSHRRKLEWLTHIPEFEELFAQGLDILELPGPRQGIGLRPSINALLLENKVALVRWAFSQYRHLFPAALVDKISRDFGLEGYSQMELDDHLTPSQWTVFQENFLFALSRDHRRYKHAQALLFQAYHHVVEHTVNRVVFDAAKRKDCMQEGALALLHAIDKVDDSQTSLAAYAKTWIKRQVKNYLMGERFPVHVPINLASKTLRQESDGVGEAPGGAPSQSRPATELERRTARIMEELRQPGISLDDSRGDTAPLADQLADESEEGPRRLATRRDLHELVGSLIATLTDKQREVLELRFGLNGRGEGKTLNEISREIGISHQQVSMREKRALQKLEDILSPYLAEIHTVKS